jgi:hypothetical protein
MASQNYRKSRLVAMYKIDMMTTDLPTKVWIETISATPMRAGWGSKASNQICDLASAKHITLALEVAQDEDSDDEDEGADYGARLPSSGPEVFVTTEQRVCNPDLDCPALFEVFS